MAWTFGDNAALKAGWWTRSRVTVASSHHSIIYIILNHAINSLSPQRCLWEHRQCLANLPCGVFIVFFVIYGEFLHDLLR